MLAVVVAGSGIPNTTEGRVSYPSVDPVCCKDLQKDVEGKDMSGWWRGGKGKTYIASFTVTPPELVLPITIRVSRCGRMGGVSREG
jgi:hypothetical protein